MLGVMLRSRFGNIVMIVVGAFVVLGILLGGGVLLSVRTAEPHPQQKEAVTPLEAATIVLTRDGFEPNEVTIVRGGSVTFTTTAGRPFWPASNLHPDHTIYSEFDPKEPVAPDESWTFTFDQVGDWGLHDHIRSYYRGVIHVVDPE